MRGIRYIFLILFAFPFVKLCSQNEVQRLIDNAKDSLNLGKYRNAIPLLESALIDKGLTPKQSTYVQTLLQISYFNKPSFKFDLLKLKNLVNYIDYDDPYNIIGFITIVEVNNNLKDYEKSIEWGNKGLKAFLQFKNNELYAKLLGDLAFSYYSVRDYQKAIRYCQKAISIIDKYYDGEHSNYWLWLNHISWSYEKIENYSKAIDYQIQSLNQKENFTQYLSYIGLEGLYKKNGEDRKAADVRKKWESQFFDTNKTLNKIFHNQKDADLATLNKTDIAVQIERVEISRKTNGELHKSFAQALIGLARCYFDKGVFDSAILYQTKAQYIYFKIYGFANTDYITASQNLSFYFGENGYYSKAIEIEYNTIRILQKVLEINDSNRISALSKRKYFVFTYGLDANLKKLSISLHNLAFWYSKIKEYDTAIKLDMDALIIQKEISNKLDYDGTRNLETLALSYLEIRDYVNFYNTLQDTYNQRKDIIISKFLIFISQERETYWNSRKLFFQDLPQFVIRTNEPYSLKVASICYDAILFSKGLLLNTSVELEKLLLDSGDTVSIQLFNRFRELNINPNIRVSADSIANIERELLKKSKIFGDITKELKITWKDIQPVLKSEEVAIEFSFYQKEDKIWYCAFLLKNGMEYPVMVPLFEQKQLDSLLFCGKVGANDLYASRGITSTYVPQLPNGQKLYNFIWKPLEKELRNVKTVYYSPSGSLHQIAFAALPIDSTTYLCDNFNLMQLSSTRQLATSAWQTKPEQTTSIALFGGIKYDLDGPEITKLQQLLPKNDLAMSRGFTSDSTLRSNPYDSLPGTRKEVESIAAMLQTNNIKTAIYAGIQGTEEAFKSLSNQKISVLHVATHGFFYPDIKEKPQDLDHLMITGEQKFRYVSNPLRRSGLILAGGNRTWTGEEPISGMEDGILTTQEISEMNLQNTELVVLSACETGLGDIKGGEGVFGLQRAFKLAGVKTIIMSLWKVPDGSTSEMMQLFYSKWLGGMDKREAFRETQHEMRKRYPKSPKDWAGFVMLD